MTASVRSAKGKFIGEKAARKLAEAEAEAEGEEEEGSCCGAGAAVVVRPAIERLGSPDAPVKVVGFLPDSTKFDGAVDLVRKLAGTHVESLSVTLHSMTTVKAEEEMKRLGHEGPGFFVNGKKQFTLREAGGAAREVLFEGVPGKKYKLDDLEAVIEQAIADLDGSGSDAETPAPTAEGEAADVAAGGEAR